MQKRAIVLVNESTYLYLQKADEGVDYMPFDSGTGELIDGGVLTAVKGFSTTEIIREALEVQGIVPYVIRPVSLDVLELLEL